MERCDKHPKYNGRKLPKNQCVGCATLYFAMHKKPRLLPKPTRVIKDKTKYDRKNKKQAWGAV